MSTPSRVREASTVLALALSLAACATTSPTPNAPVRAISSRMTETRRAYVLTTNDMGRAGTRTLYDLVAVRWSPLVYGDLPRGYGVSEPAVSAERDRVGVYARDGSFLGGAEVLRDLMPADVVELRRLTSIEEFGKFGRRHPAGAIVLTWSAQR